MLRRCSLHTSQTVWLRCLSGAADSSFTGPISNWTALLRYLSGAADFSFTGPLSNWTARLRCVGGMLRPQHHWPGRLGSTSPVFFRYRTFTPSSPIL